jgi:hypothetical protein
MSLVLEDINEKTHIAEIAGPELGALASKTELNVDAELPFSQDLCRTNLIDSLRLAADEHTQWNAPIGWYEGDRDLCGVNRDTKWDCSSGREDTAPAAKVITQIASTEERYSLGIFTIECCLHECRSRYPRRDLMSVRIRRRSLADNASVIDQENMPS